MEGISRRPSPRSHDRLTEENNSSDGSHGGRDLPDFERYRREFQRDPGHHTVLDVNISVGAAIPQSAYGYPIRARLEPPQSETARSVGRRLPGARLDEDFNRTERGPRERIHDPAG